MSDSKSYPKAEFFRKPNVSEYLSNVPKCLLNTRNDNREVTFPNTVVGCYAISITQFVLIFLCSVSDALSSKQYNAGYIFAIFIVIVEVEAKINSCISHLKDRNLKTFITCTKIEKCASKFS